MYSKSARLIAELIGTMFLLATVIGSGIMAENLSGGNDGVALLANTIATGAILCVLITVLAPISGAHFNPAVTLAFLVRRELTWDLSLLYIAMQVIGGLLGCWLAHVMFEADIFQFSTKARTGLGQWVAEIVATFGLVATILGALQVKAKAIGALVGLYISAAYWFTASTSFANPAVTIARSFTDTFSGIAPLDMPAFIVAQIVGAMLAVGVFAMLRKSSETSADDEVDSGT